MRLFFTLITLCGSTVFAIDCPKTPEQWAARRDGMIYGLLRLDQPNTLVAVQALEKELKICKMSAPDLDLATLPQEKCMQKTSDLVHELMQPLAQDKEDKFTAVPIYLQDAKLLDMINHQRPSEALTYIRQVIAKKPGVPDLVADAVETSVGTVGITNKYRLLVKISEPDGTLKWVNFTMPAEGQEPSKNVSVLTMTASNRTFIQDHPCDSTNGVVDCGRPKNSSKDCLACHVNGFISISPTKRLTSMGLGDHPGRLKNFDRLQMGEYSEKGHYHFATNAGGNVDVNKMGPGIGLGDNLEARRTPDFIRSCMDDLRRSQDTSDLSVKPELDKIVQSQELLKVHEERIKKYMDCGSCHNGTDIGRLPYPAGFPNLQQDKEARGNSKEPIRFPISLHFSRIYDGSMPYDDGAKALSTADRRVLASCLFKEQYGAPLGQPMTRDQMKTGRFYEFLTDIDCQTGVPKDSNIFRKIPPFAAPPATSQSGAR